MSGHGTALCGREDLCLICALSLHKESGFLWGIWMKVIPDALITLSKNLNEKTESPLFFDIFCLLDTRKTKTLQACSETSVLLYFCILSVCPVLTGIFFCIEGLVDPKMFLKYCLLL